jgi:hypothetical protein
MIKVPYTAITLLIGTAYGLIIGLAIPHMHAHPWVIVIVFSFLVWIFIILIIKENN